MNKFTQHIPNYCDGFKPKVFNFTDIDDLANKLGKNKSSLVKVVSNPFTIYSKEDIKCYWGFRGGIMGELKDGRYFMELTNEKQR